MDGNCVIIQAIKYCEASFDLVSFSLGAATVILAIGIYLLLQMKRIDE